MRRPSDWWLCGIGDDILRVREPETAVADFPCVVSNPGENIFGGITGRGR